MFENRLIHWHQWDCSYENNEDSFTDVTGLVTCPRCIDRLRESAQQASAVDASPRGGRRNHLGLACAANANRSAASCYRSEKQNEQISQTKKMVFRWNVWSAW